jgi:hypothetical protein
MAYSVDSEAEMIDIIRELLADRAVFTVLMQGDKWLETTLTIPGEELQLAPGQVARFISWSGTHDREVA